MILYVRGQASNGAEPLYVSLQDSAGKTATVVHSNPKAALNALWVEWRILRASFTGVNAAKVKKMIIGLGDRASPQKGGTGLVYLDDIRVGLSKSAGGN